MLFVVVFWCCMYWCRVCSRVAHAVNCHRCPVGKKLFQGSTWCENIDECSEDASLCYYGTCRDLDDGYACDCDAGYFGPTCRERRDAVTVVVSSTAQLAIAVCAFVLLSESLCQASLVTYLFVTLWSYVRTVNQKVGLKKFAGLLVQKVTGPILLQDHRLDVDVAFWAHWACIRIYYVMHSRRYAIPTVTFPAAEHCHWPAPVLIYHVTEDRRLSWRTTVVDNNITDRHLHSTLWLKTCNTLVPHHGAAHIYFLTQLRLKATLIVLTLIHCH